MKKTYSWPRIGLSFLLTAIIFVLEMVVWTVFFMEGWNLGTALLLHFGIIAFASYFVWMDWCGRSLHITLLFVILMGPFGAAMGLLTLVLYVFYLFYSDPVYSLIRELMPELQKTDVEVLQERIQAGLEEFQQDAEIISLKEVMKFGTKQQKLVAIEKLLKHYKPEFVPALKLAVSDESNSVRVLAATAITSLEDRFQKKLQELEKQYSDRPNDADAVLALASHLDEYSNFGVFEEEHLLLIKKEAVRKYEEYLELIPDNDEVKFKLATLLVDMKEYEPAEKLLTEITTAPTSKTLNRFFKLLEVYYKRGEYPRIREIVGKNFGHLLPQDDHEIAEKENDILFSWGSASAFGNVEEVEIEREG